jgi:hypothetical protein
MLPLILFAALAATQQISMECANTTDAGAQTQPVRGPAGSSAILKVSSSDDASKDSHQCSADYQLLVTPAAGATPTTVDILSSDGDYGRSLIVRLDGFSQDGGQIVGILAEGDSTPMTLLFDYHASGGPVQLVDLAKQFAPVMPAACIRTLDVIGITSSGTLVLETNSAKPCASLSRWLLDPSATPPRSLPPSATFLPLYAANTAPR